MSRAEHEVPTIQSWLTPAEAGVLGGMRYTKRRSEFLLRRWTGKHALATTVGLPLDLPALARIEVANRPSGAPYVRVDGMPLQVDISISDRAGYAVCVVAPHGSRVGCDLEIVEPRSDGFVEQFLTSAEQSYVNSRLWSARDMAANLIWSAKESALKVLHTGLRRDTRSVEVVLGTRPEPTGWTGLEIRTVEGRLFPGWWRRDGVFLVTCAADGPLPAPMTLDGSVDLREQEPVHSWVNHPLWP
jgi:4'-phosphopantetheinyl transferase